MRGTDLPRPHYALRGGHNMMRPTAAGDLLNEQPILRPGAHPRGCLGEETCQSP
jgi:hypothetical protein